MNDDVTQISLHSREDECLSIIDVWDQLAVHVCKHGKQEESTSDDDDRHTCACLFIVVVHQLNESLFTQDQTFDHLKRIRQCGDMLILLRTTGRRHWTLSDEINRLIFYFQLYF